MKIKTYLNAIMTVDIERAYGKPSKLWTSFALFYEKNGDLKNANDIFYRASQLQFKSIDEQASVYAQWAEMHIRARNYDSALLILKHACTS